jgi:predicted RNase H-like HicB family nuclease
VAVHDEVLAAALRICRTKGSWKFRVLEIVRALPHLNESTVRTHVSSRCCVNAPPNHPHRWDYFENVGRGIYEVRAPYRRPAPRGTHAGRAVSVREPQSEYASDFAEAPRDTVHIVVSRSGDWYVGECLELAVVSQAHTLDELVDNVRDAVALHLEGEDPAALGVVASPRLSLTYEMGPARR